MTRGTLGIGVVFVALAWGCGSDDSSGGGGAPGTGGSAQSTGGSSQGTGGNAQGTGGSSQGTGGDPQGTGGDSPGTGGTPGVCPYTAPAVDCAAACDNLKTIAAKCKDDPSLSPYIKSALAAAATGNGNGCKLTCAADSPGYQQQWMCFQGVPASMDCTAIGGCTTGNCPPN